MRYIYYVVAALIFLAVVNLSARFVGNDTQELLTDLHPDQQVAATANKVPLPAAKPPVVSAGSINVDATGMNAADIDASDIDDADIDVADIDTSEAPATSAINTPPTEIAAHDPVKLTGTPNLGATRNESGTTKPSSSPAAEHDIEAVEATERLAAAAPDATLDGTLDPTLDPTLDTNNSEPTVSDAAKTQLDIEAAEVTAAAAPNPDNTTTGVVTTKVATTKVAPNKVAANSVAANDAAATVTEAVEPSLIQSLGDSAESAATAVVGGAQQAVETVVEAARSLIETDDNKVASTADAVSDPKPSKADAQQSAIDPAVVVVAAAVTDAAQADKEAAPAAASSATQDQTQAPSQEVAAAETPATSATTGISAIEPPVVGAASTPTDPAADERAAVQAPQSEQAPIAELAPQSQADPATEAAVNTNATTRELSTAPAAVLALVHKHPGKVLIVGFFSPNCLDCKPSLAWLNEMRRKYWAQGLQVIGVNLGTQAQAKNYLQDAPVSFEILHDPQRELAAAFWLAEQPSTYLVDTSGKLLSMYQGHSASRTGEYEDAIRSALEQR